jgi:hypothetical protein
MTSVCHLNQVITKRTIYLTFQNSQYGKRIDLSIRLRIYQSMPKIFTRLLPPGFRRKPLIL